MLAAALLHDTIEDTETTEEELRGEFGDEIAAIVVEVTDVKWLRKHTRKRLQVSRAARASHRAKLVKIADKIANLRDMLSAPPAGWSIERKREYFDWAKSVVDEVRPVHPSWSGGSTRSPSGGRNSRRWSLSTRRSTACC